MCLLYYIILIQHFWLFLSLTCVVIRYPKERRIFLRCAYHYDRILIQHFWL